MSELDVNSLHFESTILANSNESVVLDVEKCFSEYSPSHHVPQTKFMECVAMRYTPNTVRWRFPPSWVFTASGGRGWCVSVSVGCIVGAKLRVFGGGHGIRTNTQSHTHTHQNDVYLASIGTEFFEKINNCVKIICKKNTHSFAHDIVMNIYEHEMIIIVGYG